MSRISVALCTHNGAAFIAEQLASILAQTRLPDQLVISDDASTDDTVALIHRIIAGAAASIRIDVTRNTEALGVTANFQQALEACSGDLIALCDQDDTWMPDRLAVLGERFDADPELLVLGSDATIVDADGSSRGFGLFEALDISAREFAEVHHGDSFAALLRRNLFTGATMMIRADLVSAASPFPGEWVHDEWLAIVGAATGKVDLLEVPLIGYRQHGANQIGARRLS
ncbi:MAG: glycosyltransferase family 2 protein, partial [Microbacteriaceae bacterium]